MPPQISRDYIFSSDKLVDSHIQGIYEAMLQYVFHLEAFYVLLKATPDSIGYTKDACGRLQVVLNQNKLEPAALLLPLICILP